MAAEISEVVRRGATDGILFSRFFFPDTFRQPSPACHRAVWASYLDPGARFVAVKMARDLAKSTLARAALAHRVSYGLTRTALMVGIKEADAMLHLDWLREQVETNPLWAETFGLRPGVTWTGKDIEVRHEKLGPGPTPIRIVARGITGGLRGINVKGYRPDFILTDDCEDEENTATPDARTKIRERYFGAIVNSLAPASEAPFAKIINNQTPIHPDSIIEVQAQDLNWVYHEYGVFTPEGGSQWPERYPLEGLLREKEGFRRRGELHVWMREKEVRITSPETSVFREGWLKHWTTLPPEGRQYYIAVDPAPAIGIEELGTTRGRRKDPQAVAVVQVHQGRVYLVEYSLSKTQDKDALVGELMRLFHKYRPVAVGVEAVAYQRVIAEDVRRAGAQSGWYIPVREIQSKRKKADRIIGTLKALAYEGRLWVHETHTDFLEQWRDYPNVPHDDLLDAVEMAVSLVAPEELYDESGPLVEGEWEAYDDGMAVEPLYGGCP